MPAQSQSATKEERGMKTTEQMLQERLEELRRQLITAAGETLVSEYFSTEKALRSMRSKKYTGSKFRAPIDAIVAYLDERGAAATEDEIIRAVIAGGYGTGDENEANPILWSLRVHLKGTGKATGKLRYGGPDGTLVGRGEWPEERFK
jgi:hypothetical protein